MSRCSFLKALLIAQICFGFCDEIFTNNDIFGSVSLEAKQKFFGTEDGSVPEHEIVKLDNWHRSKRSPNRVISIPFTDSGVTTTVVLNLVEDHDLIGPRTTGIWFAEHNPNAFNNVSYTPRPDIFTNIGDFHFYQNSDEGSAITKFNYGDDNDILIGVLKHTYTIKIAPRYMTNKWKKRSLDHAAQTGFANSTENRNNHSSPTVVIFKTPNTTRMNPSVLNHIQFVNRPATDANRRKHRDSRTVKVPDVVYPKLLVSADYQLISQKSSVEEFVRNSIAYFNVADMMYRQTDEPQIRLTITGIILAQDEFATPYVARDPLGTSKDSLKTLEMTSDHFSNETYRFSFDNYDVVIVMTERIGPSWEPYEFATKRVPLAGWVGSFGAACRRRRNTVAVNYRDSHLGIVAFVHILAHLFNVFHDESSASRDQSGNPCVMHEGLVGPQRLCWSSDSRAALRSFFRSKDSTCMYERPEKVPESAESIQGTWLSLSGQCQNRFKDSSRIRLETHCQYFWCCKNEARCQDWTPMNGSMHPDGKRRCIDEKWV